jgi:hypothetical protein
VKRKDRVAQKQARRPWVSFRLTRQASPPKPFGCRFLNAEYLNYMYVHHIAKRSIPCRIFVEGRSPLPYQKIDIIHTQWRKLLVRALE